MSAANLSGRLDLRRFGWTLRWMALHNSGAKSTQSGMLVWAMLCAWPEGRRPRIFLSSAAMRLGAEASQ
eukprot:CAMPEP_0175974342 /NCGR_PEP_ID=MMETSP0108-20121206/43323_1 /TAXON_ID=195067 ORGANISM="Goniomonas pacifica, Strain CCMP1869" /NCGR_SAMPLE_ID=MMETSP0108 /ASSEMBLY_ACC=CAM_ASM_000204 /LENGTH=68 /DNA_ID=CAMNT_0017303943 /DNA_START=674 /DNA_END=880 /DNA_ORIENTATION=+